MIARHGRGLELLQASNEEMIARELNDFLSDMI
jgi:hypothetical protein